MKKNVLLLYTILLVSCTEHTKFEIVPSDKTGVTFNNKITETDSLNIMKYEHVYNGAGVGVADLNNDGLQDLIFAGNQVSTRVYLNLGNFKFRDITDKFAGLSDNQWYSGVTIGDINGDGWADVYLTSLGEVQAGKRMNRLWVNNGCKKHEDPTFTERAEQYGIADTSKTVDAVFFDYDRDGFLDLYVLNNTVNSRMNTNYRAKVVDGTAENNDHLFHNNGDGTFTNVSFKAGIRLEGFGLGLAVGDVNGDGYPDIYVSNDYISNDILYINNGDGTFTNKIKNYMSYQSRSSMGNDMADVNNDGNLDMYTLDMMPEKYYKRKQTNNGFAYRYYVNNAKFDFEPQYVRNMMHISNGYLNGELLPFSENGQIMGIDQTDWSWSPLFADYDNDGDKDLIIANGYPKDETDKDWTKFKTVAAGFYTTDSVLMSMAPAVKIPNYAYENLGDLRFTKRNDWLPKDPSFSYGAAFVDLDNDGDLDYVCDNLNDKAFILRNYTVERGVKDANYLRIKLLGKGANSMALGAKTELWSNGHYQMDEHFLSRGYASSIDPVIHFGLGKETHIDSVKVTWPATGYITMVKNLKTNQTIEITELNSVPDHTGNKNLIVPGLLFNKRENAFNYEHIQNDFNDYSLTQKIMPHKFSQIGPRMAEGDINNDGRDDIIVGATNVLPTAVYLRKGKGFQEADFKGLTEKKDFSEADLAVVDVDNDGKNDMIAVAGGYENANETDYKHYVYYNRKGVFEKSQLPIPSFPASVVRTCDFNHDGYVDAFIGSRVKKGLFPYANHSWVAINKNGRFVADSAFRLNLGMVTDAIWTDYDNDGWEDLLVAREWNSIVLFKNMQGKALVPQNISELNSQRGIWYSLAQGDFNKDGYMDYIVGNIGENNRYSASDKYPLNLYAVDLDGDGIIDPVVSAYWPDKKGKMTEYPLDYLDELGSQSVFFELKYKDFLSFSFASINDMFDENILKRLLFKLDVNTTSSYILFNEKGKFRWEKLPRSLQIAPVKKTVVQDFNGDGWPDALIGGNDYTYNVSTGYYDSNKGILLLNNGKDQVTDQPIFKVLPPSQSGILLQGMVESLLYFKGDTSLIVAGFNRSKATVFENHIKGK
jgi:enediyne biosynthesis protein E4